jgi:hypothetical protein
MLKSYRGAAQLACTKWRVDEQSYFPSPARGWFVMFLRPYYFSFFSLNSDILQAISVSKYKN